jgi:hypothetical protein
MDEDQAPDEPGTRPGSLSDSESGGKGGWRTGCGALIVTAAIVLLGFMLLGATFVPEAEVGEYVFSVVVITALLASAGITVVIGPSHRR